MLEPKPSDNIKERLLQQQLSDSRPIASKQGELQDDYLLQDTAEDEVASEDILAQKDLDWNALHSSGVLSSEHATSMSRLDKKPRETRASMIRDVQGVKHLDSCLAVLESSFRSDVCLYVLAMLDTVCTDSTDICMLMWQSHVASQSKDHLFSIFQRQLESESWACAERASRVLTALLESWRREHHSFDGISALVQKYADWLGYHLGRSGHNKGSRCVAVDGLSVILKDMKSRSYIVSMDIVPLFAPILLSRTVGMSSSKPNANSQISPTQQLVYKSCLCLWLLTYDESAIESLGNQRILAGLIEVAASSVKEKVCRIALLALKNLVGKYNSELYTLGLKKVILSRKGQHWKDDDIPSVLNEIEDALHDTHKELTSFDEYHSRVLTGRLDWSAAHDDDQFWHEHVSKFDDNNYEVLRILFTYISDPKRSARIIAVACHDIGKYIQYSPHGRRTIKELGGKEKIMDLMAHQDPDVKKQSLSCIQKLVLSNWSILEIAN